MGKETDVSTADGVRRPETARRHAFLDALGDDAFDRATSPAGGGHPPALIVRAGGGVEAVHPEGGQLIGILRDSRFAQVSTRLDAGDALLLYTDGLTEARTGTGSMLDEEGLTAHLAAVSPSGADGLLAAVRKLIDDLGGGVSDDTAVLALSVPVRSAAVPSQEPWCSMTTV
ncbi:PP2C family protein-serine/threonine phosphatase [Planomonospora parontospora]|uniref:PP2C family protein-serine/threonine phosphatase n=1 Tax=Planomonospora parontospora TaxID=58119 RepID=UPI001670D6E6|nr:PP2C family protein-serine/threonine phosphatase [Planomonospora parontospora]GGL55885.1 hypothetical protein GCM10014719_66460 [Planomonospora parontospora subsp. antibiotica]GII18743.1 hypothetical protein Ppa05_54690 [Planomonospora parontospora subsp. antibiotica]